MEAQSDTRLTKVSAQPVTGDSSAMARRGSAAIDSAVEVYLYILSKGVAVGAPFSVPL